MIPNVFIDSNLLYSDPFFKENFGRLLIELSRKNKIQIHLSTVVLEEVTNNYTKLVVSNFDIINKEIGKLNKISLTPTMPALPKIEVFEHEIQAFYSELQKNEIINIIEYSNDILPELVQRSLKRIKPFTNKKQEFRDAIIWLSITEYIKTNKLENNVLLTDNKIDFWDSDKKQLHQDLLKDFQNIIVYSNYREYFTTNELIQKITEEINFKNWLDSLKIDEKFIVSIITTKLLESVKKGIEENINPVDPCKYFDNVDGIYFEYDYSLDAIKLIDFTVVPISNFAIIQTSLKTQGSAVIYLKSYYTKKIRRDFEMFLNLSFELTTNKIATLNKIEKVEIK
jgi:hypothetical protein